MSNQSGRHGESNSAKDDGESRLRSKTPKDAKNTKNNKRRDEDGWGGFSSYMSAKKFKLGEQYGLDKEHRESGLFNGVAIYVNGYTKPSSDELRRLINAHGGKYETYMSKSRVTHIVASNLPNSKFHHAKTTPVVKPDWIVDSIAANKRLPHSDYFLFDHKSKLQPGLKSFPSIPLKKSTSGSINTTSSIVASFDCVNHDKYCDLELKKEDDKALIDTVHSYKCNIAHNVDSIDKVREETEEFSDPEIICNSEEEDANTDSKTKTNRRISKAFTLLSSRTRPRNSPKAESNSMGSSPLIHNSNSDIKPKGKLVEDSLKRERKSSFEQLKIDIEEDNSKVPTCPLLLDSVTDNASDYDESVMELENLLPSSPSSPNHKAIPVPHHSLSASTSTKAEPLVEPFSTHSIKTSSSGSVAKAGDKGFLSEYYSHSRLHHISSWGSEFKAYVSEIQQRGGSSFPGRAELRQTHINNAVRLGMPETVESSRHGGSDRIVMHVDMDCFFVSVGLLSRPHLNGKPVAVTHSKGQGSKPDPKSNPALEKALWNSKRDGKLKTHVSDKIAKGEKPEYDLAVEEGSTGQQTFHSMAEIASCSYEARQCGVKNGMFMGRAKSLCPDLQTIPYDFDEYNRVSRILYDIVASFTHHIEAVSCDEMSVDCTDVLSDTSATAQELANLLRSKVTNQTGCTASVGIGPNILLARLATRKAKPNGVFQVYQNEAKDFIKDQTVSDLPGVGYTMSSKLTKMGVTTCGDLQAVALTSLRREFGPKTGESLHRFSLGLDDREIRGDKHRKSVSAEVNYGIRFTQESDAVSFLKELSNEVSKRLNNLGVKGRSITLKLMVKRPDAPEETAKFLGHGICNTVTKSNLLPMSTSDGTVIGQEVVTMYRNHRLNASHIRGIGIQVQKLDSTNYKDSSSSGHQSILQFANRKPGISNSLMDSSTPAQNNRVSLERRVSKKDANGLEKAEKNKPLEDNGYDANEGSFPVVDDSALRDVSFLLSPSQINENILGELPDDIAEELRQGIEQHKRQKNLLPVLDEEASTSTAADVVGQRPTMSGHSELQQHQNTASIRLPTEAHDVASSSSRAENRRVDLDREATAGPSSSLLHREKSSTEEKSIFVEDLPSVSQLDMSCFHALPRSLQQELEAAYARKERESKPEETRASPIKGTALALLRSPSKLKGKQSKKRRGRPAGSKNKQTGKLGQLRIQTGSSRDTARNIWSKPRSGVGKEEKQTRSNPHQALGHEEVICLDEDGNSTDVPNLPDPPLQESKQEPEPKSEVKDKGKVTFCGVHQKSDVRSLFKEWIDSGPEPQDEDIAMVTDYLTCLVHQKCLELAYCLVKFLIRRAQSYPKASSWRRCVDLVTCHVQSLTLEAYGAELKLS